MYEIFGIDKRTFKTETVAIAQSWIELKIILREEKPNYQAIWFERR